MTAFAEQLDLLPAETAPAPAGPVASWWPDRQQVWAAGERQALARVADYRARADALVVTDPAAADGWADLANLVEASVAAAHARRQDGTP